MKDTLFEFRCWLNKKFHRGELNNISQIEHLIDVFYREKNNFLKEGEQKK